MLTITDLEVKTFIGSTTSLKSDDLADAKDVVLAKYILPYLSEAQLNISAPHAGAIHIILMTSVKRAVINLAYAKDYMKFVVQAEVLGVKDKTAKDSRATKEDKERHQETFWKQGFESIDEMLRILEANKNTFTQWAVSPSFTLFKNSFVNSTTVFNDVVNINDSRRTFLRLKAHIRTIEDLELPKMVNSTLLISLKTKFQNNTLSDLETNVVALMQSIIVNFAMNDALVKGSIIKDKYNTFTVYDDTGLSKTEGLKTADLALLEQAKKEFYLTAQRYQLALNDLIQANLSDLGIIPSTPKEGFKPVNDPTKGYFML